MMQSSLCIAQHTELEERKKREELEKETKKLADLARQLMKHYDNCFVGLARQVRDHVHCCSLKH